MEEKRNTPEEQKNDELENLEATELEDSEMEDVAGGGVTVNGNCGCSPD